MALHLGRDKLIVFTKCSIVSRYGDEADASLQDVQWYAGVTRPVDAPNKRHYEFVITAEQAEGMPGAMLTVHGKVLGFVPLRNRRLDMITYLGEAFTQYTVQRSQGLDGFVTKDQVGFGMSEFLDQHGDQQKKGAKL